MGSENFLKRRTNGTRPAARRIRDGGDGSATIDTPVEVAPRWAGGGGISGGGNAAFCGRKACGGANGEGRSEDDSVDRSAARSADRAADRAEVRAAARSEVRSAARSEVRSADRAAEAVVTRWI